MKHLQFFFIILILLSACEYEQRHNNNIPQGFEWTNLSKSITVFIKYKQKVNGYDVSAICLVNTLYNGKGYGRNNPNAIWGKGYLHFKGAERDFTIENQSFTDEILFNNNQPLKNGMIVEVDYTPFEICDSTDMTFNCTQSPFFFFDIDFDEEQELIVNLFEGMGYHGHNAFEIYKTNAPNINEHDILSPMKDTPFDRLHDYVSIDTVNKVITIPFDIGGARYGGIQKYGLINHQVFDYNTNTIKDIKRLELIGIEKYDWENADKTIRDSFNCYKPIIYYYKPNKGEWKLVDIENKPTHN